MRSIINDAGVRVFPAGQRLSAQWVRDVHPKAIESINTYFWATICDGMPNYSYGEAKDDLRRKFDITDVELANSIIALSDVDWPNQNHSKYIKDLCGVTV